GVLMHYTTVWHGSFIVGTVFRDTDSMVQGFLSYSAPESQNEMISSGVSLDLSRDEFRLERLFVEPEVESSPFSLVPAGGIIAFTGEQILPSIETYRQIASTSGYFDSAAEGRLAHLAHISPQGVRTMTFWRTRELGERWNEQHLYGPLNELEPGKLTDEAIEASWLDINSFVVTIDRNDPTRNFEREAAGPSNV
ncbi:MAG: hypothetical protein ACRDHN_21065, partial [Thermomicrobiales bacterium]